MERHYDFKKISQRLSRYLDEDRYIHTIGVMYTAASLAMAHGCDLEKAQLAGLLHDSAKCIPSKKKLKICEREHIPTTEYELNNPFMLHAKLGAYLAKEKYDINDDEVLQSIIWHTTGKPNMTLLEKIIFTADYIEPNRHKAPNLEVIRKLAFQDLDQCVYTILRDTLDYLQEDPKEIDEMTQNAYHYYRNLMDRKQLEANDDE